MGAGALSLPGLVGLDGLSFGLWCEWWGTAKRWYAGVLRVVGTTHPTRLSTPADVIVELLASRTTNSYGKHPDEVARVLGLIETVEPLLRNVAGLEIDTRAGLEDIVATLIQLA